MRGNYPNEAWSPIHCGKCEGEKRKKVGKSTPLETHLVPVGKRWALGRELLRIERRAAVAYLFG